MHDTLLDAEVSNRGTLFVNCGGSVTHELSSVTVKMLHINLEKNVGEMRLRSPFITLC